MKWYLTAAMMGLLVTGQAYAGDDLDVTMRMVLDDQDLTKSVVREIQLPEPPAAERAAPEARDKAGAGLESAEDARDQGRAFGQEMADQARESANVNRDVPDKPDVPAAKPERPERPELPAAVDEIRDKLPEVAKPGN